MTHRPTDELRAQVSALTAFGVTHEKIAGYIGLSLMTLRKHYKDELAKAQVEKNAQVAGFLFQSATGATIADGASYSDCLRAAMFWLKTQAGWRETDRIEMTGADGGAIKTDATVSDDLRQALDAIAGKITGSDSEG